MRLFLSSLSGWTDANQGYTGHDVHGPHPGTCRWILPHPVFEAWLNGPESSLLFITGTAGCGKSFLAKYLRDQLPTLGDQHGLTAAFFCNATRTGQNEPPVLHYFIYEILSRRPSFFKHASSKYRDRNQRSPPILTTPLVEILQSIAKDPDAGKIVLLIDGLDECHREFSFNLLRQFDWMLKEDGPESIRKLNHIRIVITCREENGIESWCSNHFHIRITPEDLASDISTYVDSEMARVSQRKIFKDTTSEAVGDIIKKLASGVFLWVRNIIEELEHLQDTSFQAVLRTIWSCPRNMEEYYEQALRQLEDPSLADIALLLMIIYFATRPLTIPELLEVLGIVSNSDVTHFELTSRLRSTSRLLRISSGGEVELFHYSLRECLGKRYDYKAGHLNLARVCLKYLCKSCFSQVPPWLLNCRFSEVAIKRLENDHPLLIYAVSCIGYHLRESEELVDELIPHLSTFLSTSSAEYQTWDYVSDWLTGVIGKPSGHTTPVLHVLAIWNAVNVLDRVHLVQRFGHFGWVQQIKVLWKEVLKQYKFRQRLRVAEDCDISCHAGWTMLHHACIRSHSRVVEFFLSQCPLVNMKSIEGDTPLHFACGDPKQIRLLIAAGADVNAENVLGATPLMVAVSEGEESVQLLLEQGALPNAKTKYGVTTLEFAIDENDANVVQLLVDFVVDVNQPTSEDAQPISYAIIGHCDEVFDILLDRANLELRSSSAGTCPLHEAVLAGSLKYTRSLLDKGVRPDVLVDSWSSVLIAIDKGYDEIAKILLLNGASARIASKDGTTSLHKASSAGFLEICEMLLDLGADVNALDAKRWTPLMYATWASQELVVRLLLQHRADPSIQDRLELASPLHAAAGMGKTSIVYLLLTTSHPPDINSTFEFGETPAALASTYGYHEVVELLIANWADIDKPNQFSESPLFKAVSGNHEKVVEVLLKHHADLRTPGQDLTPLYECARMGNDTIANFLLERWPRDEVDLQNSSGRSPLYAACARGHFKVARSLIKYHAQPDQALPRFSILLGACSGGNLKLVLYLLMLTGASIDEPGFQGWTPLMCACDGGHLKLVEYLLFRGADPKARNEEGYEAIHRAVLPNRPNKAQILKLLLSPKHGVDVNATVERTTPLFTACENGDTEIVALLLKNGANPATVCGDIRWSPLSVACKRGKWEVVSMLLKNARVNVTQTDFMNRSCLHIALTFSRKDIVSLIFSTLQGDRGDTLERLIEMEDFFGRSAFDYIIANFPRRPKGRAENALEHFRQRSNIISLIAKLKEGFEHLDLNFSLLGKELIYLNDDENAIYSYQRHIDWTWFEGMQVLSHIAICDSCGTVSDIQSSRYVCRTCPDIDLCETCYGRYTRGIYSERTCKTHAFLRVPIPTFSAKEVSNLAVEVDHEAIHDWLDLLEAKYRFDTVSRSGTGLSDGSPDPTWFELTMTSLHCLGYLRFYTPLTRLPRPLGWPQVECLWWYADAEGYVMVDSDEPEDDESEDEEVEYEVD